MLARMIARGFGAQQRRAALAALAVLSTLLLSLDPAVAQGDDPFDRRATDWRLEDWQGLNAETRAWVLFGFSLGWYGPPAAGEPEGAPLSHAAVVERLRRVTSRAEANPEVRLGALLVAAQARAPVPRFAMTGADWMALSVRHRLAVLHGFYAGAYGRVLNELLGGEADEAALDAAFAKARQLVEPELALAPALLFARLSDWYFYTDRRAAPLVLSIQTIAGQIRQPGGGG